jgi:putative NADPH-quinone reductase
VKEKGGEVEILDLYDTEYKQDFLRLDDIKLPLTSEKQDVRDKIQEKIRLADELVFIHPLWWGGMPAILKNFVDNNFVSGFAFKNTKRWWPGWLLPLPERLLSGKTVKLYITCDIPTWMFWGSGLFIFTQWFFPIFLYCGLRLTSFHLFTNMRWRSEKTKEKWLTKIYREGKNSG